MLTVWIWIHFASAFQRLWCINIKLIFFSFVGAYFNFLKREAKNRIDILNIELHSATNEKNRRQLHSGYYCLRLRRKIWVNVICLVGHQKKSCSIFGWWYFFPWHLVKNLHPSGGKSWVKTKKGKNRLFFDILPWIRYKNQFFAFTKNAHWTLGYKFVVASKTVSANLDVIRQKLIMWNVWKVTCSHISRKIVKKFRPATVKPKPDSYSIYVVDSRSNSRCGIVLPLLHCFKRWTIKKNILNIFLINVQFDWIFFLCCKSLILRGKNDF